MDEEKKVLEVTNNSFELFVYREMEFGEQCNMADVGY